MGAVTENEKDLISRFPLAVSIGVPVSSSTVDYIAPPQDSFRLKNYWYHVYEAVNPLINDIELALVQLLADAGYSAFPVPASQTVDIRNLYGIFSHKLAASLAGLGWIGKSCLLITPDRGPRVRWGTILTDAMLKPEQASLGKGCGGCNKCVDICPAGAFSGKAFRSVEPRVARMDAHKCLQFIHNEQKNNLGVEACGLCVYVCPFGQKRGGRK
jgi:epoxyqueuosine reductase QueG